MIAFYPLTPAARAGEPDPGRSARRRSLILSPVTGHYLPPASRRQPRSLQVRFMPQYEGSHCAACSSRPDRGRHAPRSRRRPSGRSPMSSRRGSASSPVCSPTMRSPICGKDRTRRSSACGSRPARLGSRTSASGGMAPCSPATTGPCLSLGTRRRAAGAHRRVAGRRHADHRARVDARRQLLARRRRGWRRVRLAPRAARRDAARDGARPYLRAAGRAGRRARVSPAASAASPRRPRRRHRPSPSDLRARARTLPSAGPVSAC